MGNCCRFTGARQEREPDQSLWPSRYRLTQRRESPRRSSRPVSEAGTKHKLLQKFTTSTEYADTNPYDLPLSEIPPRVRPVPRRPRSRSRRELEPQPTAPALEYDSVLVLMSPKGQQTVEFEMSAQPSEWTSTSYCSTEFEVTNEATTLEWKGYGLKIQVLDDSIPQYLTSARLDVSVHIFNKQNYKYIPVPLDSYYPDLPASALYSIKVGSGKLCKPVTIEIQHCSVWQPYHYDLPVLLRAANEGEYFRPVTDAMFDRRTKYGRVTLPKLQGSEDQEYNNFSWFIVAIRQVFFPRTIHYKAQVYVSHTALKMHFVVTMAVDPCTTVVKTEYRDSDVTYELQATFAVEFDSTSRKILLGIPLGGVALKSGWEITPLYNPLITKYQVDRFCIFHNNIPKCAFSMHWSKESPPKKLKHRFDLTEGTANCEKHFFVSLDPAHSNPSTPSARASSLIHQIDGYQLNEQSIDKYLQIIPNEDLVKLGVELGLRYDKLRNLKSTENFCLNLISAWLREEDEISERSGKPSWENLAKALEEIGQTGIARTIRDNAIIANDH